MLFNILTLSLYRFWGRTNVRRYLWSNIRFKGDPLEYTGTGGEMFIGFIVVLVLVFLPVTGTAIWAQKMMLEDNPLGFLAFSALYLVMLWLFPLALYRAQRYRLSRTRWRGIRGSLVGNGTGYATAGFGYGLLTLFTFGLGLPFMENQLFKKESNDRRSGSGRFSYDGGVGPL